MIVQPPFIFADLYSRGSRSSPPCMYVFVARLSHISCYVSQCMGKACWTDRWMEFTRLLLPLNRKSFIHRDTINLFMSRALFTFPNNWVFFLCSRCRKLKKSVPLNLDKEKKHLPFICHISLNDRDVFTRKRFRRCSL